MGEIKEYIKRLKTLTTKRQEASIFSIIINRQANTILDLNQEQMLFGQDSEGGVINPPYASVKYAEFKLYLNPRGVVDLRVTGAFYNGMFIYKSGGFPIRISSRDKKTPMLVAKYGKDIFGLQKQNKEVIAGDAKEDIQQYYKGVLPIR